jgi:hypothetical protein
MKFIFAFSLTLSLLMMTNSSHADCIEYTIIDHGDRVEAVCVGEPLTEAQKKEQEKLKEEKTKLETHKTENQTTTPNALPVTSQQNLAQPIQKVEVVDDGSVEIISYDVKFIHYPSSTQIERRRLRKYETINGLTTVERIYLGEYSIKIDAKNNGRRGAVQFKLKIVDFSGFEIQALAFTEDFEKDQRKMVTSVQPGNPVTFIKSNDWIIETFKH